MNVGKLKEMIAELSDDMPVLMPGHDHNYMLAIAGVGFAILEDGRWSEDDWMRPSPKGKLALIFSAG